MKRITKNLVLKIFAAFYMERWNDKLRPMPLIELDKQAHKMIIAYFLGSFEKNTKNFNWLEIIEGGFFELLQRIIITDVKPQIYYKIKENEKQYKKLNDYIYKQLLPYITPLGKLFVEKFENYFLTSDSTVNKRILNAAHLYASKWEFEIIENSNPHGYEIDKIRFYFQKNLEKYYDLEGFKELSLYENYQQFIDLCGQLRFQSRWANLHRIPKTSVLGHSLFVAMFSYLLSLELEACPARITNNYFTGLFHDLPEVLTRDIISPVKKSVEGLNDLIKNIEKEHMQDTVYPLIPPQLQHSIKMFTENEFDNIIVEDNVTKKVSIEKINTNYNHDKYNPRDGALVKTADELSSYIEAREALNNGCNNKEFKNAINQLHKRYKNKELGGIDFSSLMMEFAEHEK